MNLCRVFLLRFLAGGLAITMDRWSYSVTPPSVEDLVGLVGVLSGYLYKRTTDQRAQDRAVAEVEGLSEGKKQ